MSKTSRVTAKGQVTIPRQIKIDFGFHPETTVRSSSSTGR